MPSVRGCNLPDELLYDVENNIWYRENPDGTDSTCNRQEQPCLQQGSV